MIKNNYSDWKHFTTDLQWQKYIRNLVLENEGARHRMLLLLYDAHKKYYYAENETGLKGFEPVDISILTDMAKKIENGFGLSESSTKCLKQTLPKYWKQFKTNILYVYQQRIDRAEKRFLNSIGYVNDCLRRNIKCGRIDCKKCPIAEFKIQFNFVAVETLQGSN